MTAAIEDRRDAIAQQTEIYRARHFPDGHMPPKHDWRRRPSAQIAGTESFPAPGGVGYGYFFNTNALLWTNSTIADYYVDAPTFPGGTVPYLYLTSTCRAQLGTESLVAYETNDEAAFWIYDWSQLASNPYPWEVLIDLPVDNPQYLTTRPDEFAITRQMVHVRNGTYYLGFSNGLYNWQNQTLLFDFKKGNWDLVYSANYTTTNLANNLPGAGEYDGSWGPIIETFPPYTNVNPVGFDLIRLFQDGNANPSWLTPSNSYFEYNYGGGTSNWTVLTQATNTSFTACYSSNSTTGNTLNLGSLCVTANTKSASFSLSPSLGTNSSSWIITPNSNRWDKTVVGLAPGAYTITFSNASGIATPAQQAVTIATNTVATVQASYGLKPTLQSATVLGQTMTCIWSTQTNFSYQVQCTTNLVQTNWSNWGSPIATTNGTAATTNSIAANPQWFCRLMLLQ